jgi:hypothetical protein
MDPCHVKTDQWIYAGLTIYLAVCCTAAAMWHCAQVRRERPIPPLPPVETVQVAHALPSPPTYRQVI